MNTEVYNAYFDANTSIKYKLTKREIEYLGLVALGCHNYEIAKILYVTDPTVKKALEKIFRKLHALDRANAVAIAFIHEILDVRVLTQLVGTYELRTHYIYQ